MARITAIINQKGGVGKSTTAHALYSGLSLTGYKALAIDLDAQGNLTYTAGVKTDGATAFGMLTGEVKTAEAIQHTNNGDVIAASKNLSIAASFLIDTGKEYKLKEALEEAKESYDYIIIDTPPALGILTINALTACDDIIVPAQADIYSLQGVEQLAETMQPVKKYCNPQLRVDGILLTRYNARTALSRDITEYAEKMAAQLGTRVYDTRIREAVTIKEAQLVKQSIFDYAPKAKVTDDYRAFLKEYAQRS